MQRIATERLRARSVWLQTEPEEFAFLAAAHVELVADDGKPHGMNAVQKLTVFDGVQADILGKLVGTAAVPAGSVS